MNPAAALTKLKVARVIAGAVAVPVIVYTGWRHRSQLRAGLSLIPRLSPGWLLIGVTAEAGSLVMFALLQRGLLGDGRHRVTRTHAVLLIIAGNAMTNSLPGGPAWSSAWYWSQLRQRTVSSSRAAWSIVGSGFFSGVSLALLVSIGAEWAGDRGPLASLRYAGAAVVGATVVLVSALALTPRHLKRRWSATLGRGWMRSWSEYSLDLHGARVIPPLAKSLANWTLDLVLLGMCLRSLEPQVKWSWLLAAYGLTQLAAIFPVTPGGIAVVEGTLVALLTAYGTPTGTAVAAVVLYRAVSFWGATPLGWIAYAALETRRPVHHRPSCNDPAHRCHTPIGVRRLQEA